MNYYPHHIGDFRSGTVNISRLERWRYRDLLDVYYDTEKPLPADLDAVCYSVGANSDEGRRIVENTPQFDARTALARWAGVDLLAEPCPTQTSIASRSRRLCGWHKPTPSRHSSHRVGNGRFPIPNGHPSASRLQYGRSRPTGRERPSCTRSEAPTESRSNHQQAFSDVRGRCDFVVRRRYLNLTRSLKIS
ncbi:Protein of unknown function [Burkholderia sp. CF099]|nr:Protein of unknown function [Burkholderia sp. CF099]